MNSINAVPIISESARRFYKSVYESTTDNLELLGTALDSIGLNPRSVLTVLGGALPSFFRIKYPDIHMSAFDISQENIDHHKVNLDIPVTKCDVYDTTEMAKMFETPFDLVYLSNIPEYEYDAQIQSDLAKLLKNNHVPCVAASLEGLYGKYEWNHAFHLFSDVMEDEYEIKIFRAAPIDTTQIKCNTIILFVRRNT